MNDDATFDKVLCLYGGVDAEILSTDTRPRRRGR